MTLSLRDRQLSFFDVSFLASNLFDDNDPFSLFRQKILPALEAQRERLEAMYGASNGRPAVDPVLVAGVTLLQFLEKAPDRRALQEVRMNLGWKKALGLAVDDPGFHPTTLVYFRQRLLEHQQGRVAFDALLQGLEQERYLDSEVRWHKLSKEALAAKFQQTGQDMQVLLAWVENHEDRRAHEKTKLLQRVFAEQFEVTAAGPAARKQEASGTVQNPHDPEAQWAAKDPDKTKTWVGYKVQIAETVPETPGPKAAGEPTPAFVTEVTTTEAMVSDPEGCRRLEQQQQEHGLGRAGTKYVDSAYVTDDTLAQAATPLILGLPAHLPEELHPLSKNRGFSAESRVERCPLSPFPSCA